MAWDNAVKVPSGHCLRVALHGPGISHIRLSTRTGVIQCDVLLVLSETPYGALVQALGRVHVPEEEAPRRSGQGELLPRREVEQQVCLDECAGGDVEERDVFLLEAGEVAAGCHALRCG